MQPSFVKYVWQIIMSKNGYLSGDHHFRSSLASFWTDIIDRKFLIILNLDVLPQDIFLLVLVLPFEGMKNAFNFLPTSFMDVTGHVPWEADSEVDARIQGVCEGVLSGINTCRGMKKAGGGTRGEYGLWYRHNKGPGHLMGCPETGMDLQSCPTLRQGE